MSTTTERYEVSLNTPAGQLTTAIEVPSGFVPITAIVPLMRRLGEGVQALEEERAVEAGQSISCRKGCAACCRMLVPVSPPEAFALHDWVHGLPDEPRRAILRRVAEANKKLEQAGLLGPLTALAETDRSLTDEDFEPLNRDYYALRMACPFLENEACSIYDDRPAACRELLVTSPAELCDDIASNPVRPIPVSVRIGTILGLLWSDLDGEAPRLIPLPLALDWADRHRTANRQQWKGTELLDKALDKVWRLLSQAFTKK
jgi:Fe-S-cluster containining protein